MTGRVFSIAEKHPPMDGLTISSSADMGAETSVTYFSLGKKTDITPESYASPALYLCCGGSGAFLVGSESERRPFHNGDILIIQANTRCGISTDEWLVYTEIITKKEIIMNEAVKIGEVLKLAELVTYEDDSIVNMDIASNETMKFAVMAFDGGTELTPHRAPGDALVFALEGKAVIGYEGVEHHISAGENFRFAKGGLHSVKADGQFKMALLIILR